MASALEWRPRMAVWFLRGVGRRVVNVSLPHTINGYVRLPKYLHLRASGEFRRVYAYGKRYDGSLMTAFIRPNDLQHHRFGITASRKAIGNAVERNRSKRLLREAIRHSGATVEQIDSKYDWVLNAKRALLKVSSMAALEELQRIISRVQIDVRVDRVRSSSVSQ